MPKTKTIHETLRQKPDDGLSVQLYSWKCGIAYYLTAQADPKKTTCKKCIKRRVSSTQNTLTKEKP